MALVVVSGALANKPFSGGEAWVRMSWVEGLVELGFDVLFVEQVEASRLGAEALRYYEDVVRDFGLAGRSALVDRDGASLAGLSTEEVRDRVGDAQLLANISGNLTAAPLVRAIPCRAYIDLDPGFTQIWTRQGGDPARLAGHHHYFTVGENIGQPDCPIPTLGLEWRPLPPPVVLSRWPVRPSPPDWRWTTVSTWRSPLGALELGGATLRGKHHEWRRVIELPRHVRRTFEIALAIDPGDRVDLDALHAHGWQTADPRDVVARPAAFREYVQASGGECSIASGVYAQTNSGWFSDRTVRYLASGRPALVQKTGFDGRYPVGEGLVGFSGVEDAAAGARDIAADYERHCIAARSLAETYFASELVLGRFAADVGVSP